MAKRNESFEACEVEAFWDGLEHHLKAVRSEMDSGSGLSAEELADIAESIRRDDYLQQWGEIDPLAAGFKPARREGA